MTTNFSLYILPSVLKEIGNLPGNVRQPIRAAVRQLPVDPEPPSGKHLNHPLKLGWEVWRLKLGSWRVIYVIDREMKQIYVVGVRKRPPYEYDDLDGLMMQIK